MNSQEQHEQADCTPQREVHYVEKLRSPTRDSAAQAAAQMRATWLKDAQETWVVLGRRGSDAIVRCSRVGLDHYAVPTTGMGVSHG